MHELDERMMRHLLLYNMEHNKYTPFAAMLVNLNGEILSYGLGYHHNNPAHHAETDAINQCSSKYNLIKWTELTMYSTGEPCIMCSAACCWVNVKRIVFATDVPFIYNLWKEESNMRCRDIINVSPNKPELVEHTCKDESDDMFLSYKDVYQKLIDDQKFRS